MNVLWLWLVVITFFQFANAADLVIYADYKNKPKIYQNDDGHADGILADILTEVTKRSGLTFEYRFYPWARAYRFAISDENGGIIGLSYTSERSKIIDYSEPMFIDEMVIFTKKSGYFDFQDINSLKGKTLAVKIGVSYGDDYEAAIKEKIFKIESVNNRLSQFRMLALERVDAILIGPSAHTGWYIECHSRGEFNILCKLTTLQPLAMRS